MLEATKRLAIGVLAGSFALWPSAAAHAGWQEDLASEIRLAYGCQVKELSKVVESQVQGIRVIASTVQCVDGRKFTAGKVADQPFIFEQCDAQGKRACP